MLEIPGLGKLVEEDDEIWLYAARYIDPENSEEERYRNGDILPDLRRVSEAVFEDAGELISDPVVSKFLDQPIRRSFKRPRRLGDAMDVRVHLPRVLYETIKREARRKGVPISRYMREILEAREKPTIVTPPYPHEQA